MVAQEMAFVDMEFGHVYGTKKLIYMPIEVGVLLYDPQNDSVSTSQRKIKKDIVIEMWKNTTDDLKRTTGSTTTCANLAKEQYQLPYDGEYALEMEELQPALKVTWSAYADLNTYLTKLTKEHHIQTMVFFSKRMEMAALARAKFDAKNFQILDIQDKIKDALNMEKLLSLDRVSYALDIDVSNSQFRSKNFDYSIPETYASKIKPHRALGDAARIFLAYKEFKRSRDDLRSMIREYFRHCRETPSANNKK
jgi:NAD-specific glutamate dehydrogenase